MVITSRVGKIKPERTSVLSVPQMISYFFEQKFEQWLAKRIPLKKEHQLNSRNIMIYPTRFGLSYLLFVVVVFLLGTNYQNNIILLLSYLLTSLFISVMLHSFYNFSSLRFYSTEEQQGYAEQTLYFPIKITAKKIHYDINLQFSAMSLKSSVEKVMQCQRGEQQVNLAYKSTQRGKHQLGRVTVFSEYSLGLFKSKTVLDFGHYAIIYPKPKRLISGQYHLSSQADEPTTESYQTSNVTGIDDFSELKSFVRGESKARTAWKQLAKGQGHYSKHYQASQGNLQWLKLSEMPGNNIETKLSYLSFLIGELTATNQSFGLALSKGSRFDGSNVLTNDISYKEFNIKPGTGLHHQQACLTALALYS